MKKLNYYKDSAKIVEILINKELEKYSVTVDDIKRDGCIINGKDWYQYYTFDSEEEFLSWKNFCIEFLTTRVSPKRSRECAEEEFMWINLQYGLKYNYNTNGTTL